MWEQPGPSCCVCSVRAGAAPAATLTSPEARRVGAELEGRHQGTTTPAEAETARAVWRYMVRVVVKAPFDVTAFLREDRRPAQVASVSAAGTPLLGPEGPPAAAVAALAGLLLRVSRLADDLPEITELELSPVIAGPGDMRVAGARIRISPAQPQDPFLRRLR